MTSEPGRWRTSPTRPGVRRSSPAPRAARPATPRSSWPAPAPGWCSPAAVRRQARGDRGRDHARGPRRRARARSSSTWPTSPRSAGAADGRRRLGPIDVLVNNAGVMAHAAARRTVDGLESADGDQPLRPVPAHRAAAARSWSRRATRGSSPSPRRCTGSRAQRPLGDPRPQPRRYSRWRVYGADQAGQPALHLRARPALPRGRAAGHGARRAPRLRRHAPGDQRPARAHRRAAPRDPRRRGQGGRRSPPRRRAGRR